MNQRRTVDDFDWSFACGEDVVYSKPWNDEYIVLPRRVLEELAAVIDAKTWGALRAVLSRERFELAVEVSKILEDGEYEGKTWADIPDHAAFDVETVDQEFPASPFRPEWNMEEWLPKDVAEAFGTRVLATFGDEWLMIVDIESVVAGLRSGGASCVEDDELVMAAYNGRTGSVGDPAAR
jgi:hypothetical protein